MNAHRLLCLASRLHASRRGLLALLLCLASLGGAWAEPLVFTVSVNRDALHVDAALGAQHQAYDVPDVRGRLKRLYTRLEGRKYKKADMLAELRSLGTAVYGPAAALLAGSTEIQYVIPPALTDCPLDLLVHDGRYVFLTRPVSFGFARQPAERFAFSPRWRAVIVSDPSADPENGCALLKKMLPASTYSKADDFSLEDASKRPDVLLISAHGDIHFNDTDSIGVADDDVKPVQLARIAPRLVYLDSCQLGASSRFVLAFQKAGTEYYLAPITSNEAGDSSTKTIRWFFERLQAGDTPTRALFATRTRLFKTFENSEALDRLLWKAYPFRVYRLRAPS